MKYPMLFGCLTAAIAMTTAAARADQIKTVFVIALENNNFVQPDPKFPVGGQQQIFQNPAAPFINSLLSGNAVATINGRQVNISRQTAYATNYRNALATAGGNNPHIHPSEPQYFWAEAGTNYNIFNDDDPFAQDGGATENFVNNQDNQLHLVRLLAHAGKTWRSYQEDIDLTPSGTALINTPLPRNQWTVPLTSFSGNFVGGTVNQFNGSTQYNYAAKHNPMVFFTDSNGGNDPTPANPLSQQYAPLQQLFIDLAQNNVADYNWITPNQFNDMHTALAAGFNGLTQDAARVAQGDHFLSIVIPQIMASRAYQDHGAIIIWTDETEPVSSTDNPDDLTHSLTEIVISPDAHPNVPSNTGPVPYASNVYYTHSSDLRTMQEIFNVTSPLLLGDALRATDLSDLFAAGAIPNGNSGRGDGNQD